MLRERQSRAWSELDQEVFKALVPVDHILRRVDAGVDFEAFHTKLADFYHPQLGRPGDAVLMVRFVFLQFWYGGLSDRDVLARAQTDVATRWFLGLGIQDKLPDSSTFTCFRSRLGVEGTQRVMDELIGQARDHGLLRNRLRLKDATHVVANVAIPTTLTLLAQLRTELLTAARPFAAEQVQAAEARMVEIRAATDNCADDVRLMARVGLLQDILAWADPLVRPVDGDERLWEKFDRVRKLAHKILKETLDPQAGDRTRSVYDPDARRGKHGDYFDGYLVDVLMDSDSELITAVNVLPANGAEGADAIALVRHEEAVTGDDIQSLSIDGAGCVGEVLRELQQPGGLNLDVYVPPKVLPASSQFPATDFIEDELRQTVTCPAGQVSRYHQRDSSDHATSYRFHHTTCAACALKSQCLGRELKNSIGRSVRKNDYEPEYAAARAKAATPEYAAVKREHPKIERKLAELVRRHGARRARYRGQGKVLSQQLWTAIAVNVKRTLHLLSLRSSLALR